LKLSVMPFFFNNNIILIKVIEIIIIKYSVQRIKICIKNIRINT